MLFRNAFVAILTLFWNLEHNTQDVEQENRDYTCVWNVLNYLEVLDKVCAFNGPFNYVDRYDFFFSLHLTHPEKVFIVNQMVFWQCLKNLISNVFAVTRL